MPNDKIDEQDTGKEDANKLGMSRGIYAAGHSFKDGLIWGTIATIASVVILSVGRENPTVARVVDVIEKKHGAVKNWIATKVNWVAAKLGREMTAEQAKHAVGPAVTSTALIVGGLVGHAVQVPAARKGWKQAEGFIEKHNRTVDEKDQLIDENKHLKKKLASFTERVSQASEPQQDGAINR